MDKQTLSKYVPLVTDIIPRPNSTTDTLLPIISVKFSVDMDWSLLTTFKASSYINSYFMLRNRSTGALAPLSLSEYTSNSISLIPSAQLDPGAEYILTIMAGLAAMNGRGMPEDYSSDFETTGVSIQKVLLSKPIDMTVHQSVPVLTWRASGSSYRVQIANDTTFAIPIFDEIVSETAIDNLGLDGGYTYYWRVREEDDNIGPWSDVWCFVLEGDKPKAFTGIRGLRLVSISPAGDLSFLTEMPVFTLTFSEPIDAVTAEVVSIDIDSGVEERITVSTAITDNTVILTVAGSIEENHIYTINLAADSLSLDPIVFCGALSPMYASSLQVSVLCGRFLSRYTRQEINLTIREAGLRADSLAYRKKASAYELRDYVSKYAALKLIESYRYELLEQAGRRDQVDNISTSVDSNILGEIDSVLNRLDKEVSILEAKLNGGFTAPVTGVRSSGWDYLNLYNDASTVHLLRGKF